MISQYYDLTGQVFVITGGAGKLGKKHAEALMELGAIPLLLDINEKQLKEATSFLKKKFRTQVAGFHCDITDLKSLESILEQIDSEYKRIDGLINNAANNPELAKPDQIKFSRLENFPIDQWKKDIDVGITGAFLCSRVFGTYMARSEKGVIINVASDLGIIAPDQRLYRKENTPDDQQPVKPVTYSVVKHALIGLTKYLSTYWADKGIRANTLCPGGVYSEQLNDEFVEKLINLIPSGRMAQEGEYKGAIQFLCSDASAYMNGGCLIMDGGRTVW
jgi:NAD(P)-dependent dehydrogenase (short-subunit alcohol dehydrogenase family)